MDALSLAMQDLNKVEPRIFKLIDKGELDPWDIDITLLCDQYLKEIKARRDLRISGNALLTAAVLLRLKSKIFEEREESEPTEKPELPVPDIQIIPVSRRVERKVTVFELLDALKEAFELEKQRISRASERPTVKFYTFDISKAIEKIIAALPDEVVIERLGAITLLALLHLASKGAILIEQEEWNGAIRVKKVGGSGIIYGRKASEERRAG